MIKKSFLAFGIAAMAGMASTGMAQPVEWQLGFQEPVTPIMEEMHDFHNLLLVIITVISLFVMGLLAYVCVRFSAKNNPVPSKTTHNTLIEIIWTAVPVMILVVIAIPSFKLLYHIDESQDADMTIKAIGHQWYWEYVYPDEEIRFDSYLIRDEDLKPGQLRLLEVDNRIVVPVDTKVRLLTSSADVIHAWAIPAFGVKMDAVPGRVNETWFQATKTGTYYGQCSELCGRDHGFMPIVVEVVSKADYQRWLTKAKEEFASYDPQSDELTVAMNPTEN